MTNKITGHMLSQMNFEGIKFLFNYVFLQLNGKTGIVGINTFK